MTASGWVQLGARVKDIWFWCQEESLGEGAKVGLQVGSPGTKECAGCEQVGAAELCMWVPRCGKNLHMFSGFAQQGRQDPLPLEDPGPHLRSRDPDPESQEVLPSLGSAHGP